MEPTAARLSSWAAAATTPSITIRSSTPRRPRCPGARTSRWRNLQALQGQQFRVHQQSLHATPLGLLRFRRRRGHPGAQYQFQQLDILQERHRRWAGRQLSCRELLPGGRSRGSASPTTRAATTPWPRTAPTKMPAPTERISAPTCPRYRRRTGRAQPAKQRRREMSAARSTQNAKPPSMASHSPTRL